MSAEFLPVKSSVSDLLNYGFRIEQIDTIKHGIDVVFVYHLIEDTNVAICTYGAFSASATGKTLCTIDTINKDLIEDLKILKQLNNN